MKKWLKSVYIHRSYRKIKTGVPLAWKTCKPLLMSGRCSLVELIIVKEWTSDSYKVAFNTDLSSSAGVWLRDSVTVKSFLLPIHCLTFPFLLARKTIYINDSHSCTVSSPNVIYFHIALAGWYSLRVMGSYGCLRNLSLAGSSSSSSYGCIKCWKCCERYDVFLGLLYTPSCIL